jgi:hypothetical protein
VAQSLIDSDTPMRIPYYQVDAFAARTFGGNPAGVCVLANWLPDEILQSIAAENNLAETAFFTRQEDHYHLRWFSPVIEVDLCGHATLATAFVLYSELGCTDQSIRFTTKVPDLTVKYPETVKEIYDQRRAYHEHITREEYLKRYPDDSYINAEQFEEARQRIVKETLNEFVSDSWKLKDEVWQRHGTKELLPMKVSRLGNAKRVELPIHAALRRVLDEHKLTATGKYLFPAEHKLYSESPGVISKSI